MDIPVFIREVKLYTPEEDQFIHDHFNTMTHKEMGKALGRSTESLRSRCRTLELKKPARMVVAPVRTGQNQPEGRDLSELPTHLQKWFGLAHIEIPNEAKPYIRHIQERMPDFTVSKTKHSIGSGSQFQIGYLASL